MEPTRQNRTALARENEVGAFLSRGSCVALSGVRRALVTSMMPIEISTERLLLRPYRFSDVSDVLIYATDDEWARFLPVPTPYTERDAEAFLARSMLADRAQHPDWAITLGNRVVGGIDIRFMAEFRIGQIGFSISPDSWNRGLATEAARAVVDTAFNRFDGLTRIRSHADTRNKASIRVLEKVGMKYEGCLRSNRFIRGELVDDAHYGVLREEWRERRA